MTDCSRLLIAVCGVSIAFLTLGVEAADKSVPDFTKQIAPLLRKHCAGCHNNEDREGRLSLESFAELQKGGKRGPAVQPGVPASSRLFATVSGLALPKMPPEGSEPLGKDELELLQLWIEAGAKGPDGQEVVVKTLNVPKLAAPEGVPKPINSVAVSPDGTLIAAARFAAIELRKAESLELVRRIDGFPGKVNSVEFSTDGKTIIAGSGIVGLTGEAVVLDSATGERLKTIDGHRDTLYAARLSPDGKLLATGSYDRQIILWNLDTAEPVHTLAGHNGAVFDLAFSPDGTLLASASADATLKIWSVKTGERLDTLGQPLKEQYIVRFSPDGEHVIGGGLDNRIRVWRVVSRQKPQINPIEFARIAHEGAVIQLAFSPDGTRLVSIADDQTASLWDTAGYTLLGSFKTQPNVTPALSFSPDGQSFLVGRVDGSLERIGLGQMIPVETSTVSNAPATAAAGSGREVQRIDEAEPNDLPEQAGVVALPAQIKGRIQASGDATSDADLFRFQAKAGEQWVFEVNAARSKSPLDSKLEVLDAKGGQIPRVLLQAVRDSYITFRGIDSSTRDCRVHNWEEMDLNQYLYLNGEVVRLWLWPRGPDSGFQFYPQRGNRVNYFDTTATSHAVQEPCFIIEPHPPGTKLVPNGLPLVTLYYENDDDSQRQLGDDSRLHFTAPADGEYLVKVSDVRGFHGEKFTYEITARASQPDFSITVEGGTPTINSGSGKEFKVVVNRKDGFDGEIQIAIDGLPPGFATTNPLIIESGQDIAYGTLNAESGAAMPTEANSKTSTLTATAIVNGKPVTREAGTLGEIKLADPGKALVAIGPDALPGAESEQPAFGRSNPLELTIAPGETITARVHVLRNNFDGRIGFEALEHNLPHGVIVDNVGLSGLLIVEGQSERQFFITAASWVPEQTRVFHLRSKEEGGQTTWPVILHIQRRGK